MNLSLDIWEKRHIFDYQFYVLYHTRDSDLFSDLQTIITANTFKY